MAEDDTSCNSDSSEGDLEWEEVHISQEPTTAREPSEPAALALSPPLASSNIEITLQPRKKKDDTKEKLSAALHQQRVLRTACHKIHTICLLANAQVRNKWINDELLHARLLSLTPMPLQDVFAMVHKSRVQNRNERGRRFESAVHRLVDWWTGTFFTVLETGHIRNRTFEEVQQEITLHAHGSDYIESGTNASECIRGVNSLMKHALMQKGSRDTSAQLFVALCRALDIPARLVVSLQSVPWKSSSATKGGGLTGKGKGKAPLTPGDTEDGSDAGEVSEIVQADASFQKKKARAQSADNAKADPVIRLLKAKSQSTSLSGSPSATGKDSRYSSPTRTPPVFWTEVFSRADSQWLPVDPIRGIVNNRHVFDPSSSQHRGLYPPSRAPDNRMLYVVALEEDGFGRDVTARYARNYTAKVLKAQGPGSGSVTERKQWWARVVQCITRPYRLNRDDLEDVELYNYRLTEGMPTTLAGFKDHPLYILARHLKRDEVIDPPVELGKFRGEPVYPRSSVISLKTAENWMRQGRVIRPGCQPMKMVKQRVVTISRQREMELALERAKTEGHSGGDGEVMQGLYALSQTELYKPDPIRDGKIPKNEFGNIDLYVPSMLPEGAVHIPFKGVAKIAKKLEFDYAEAVTGFEFKKRRAFPIIEGIVVAAENEGAIIEAYLEAAQDAEERARARRFDQLCKRWIRLIQGLRIRDRLQKQYAPSLEVAQPEHWLDAEVPESGGDEPGGFLTTADDVVEPFHLPRNIHVFSLSAGHGRTDDEKGAVSGRKSSIVSETASCEWEPHSGDEDLEFDDGSLATSISPQAEVAKGAPKTMRELAEYHAQLERTTLGEESSSGPHQTPASNLVSASKTTEKPSSPQPSGEENSLPTPVLSSKPARSSRKRAARSESDFGEETGVTPPKRARGPLNTRVLRPRVSKSAAKVQEER